MNQWVLEVEMLRKENEALKSAIANHIKVCRGWFGDDPVWEQIIANNEWEGRNP